jgi:hypothetical protein
VFSEEEGQFPLREPGTANSPQSLYEVRRYDNRKLGAALDISLKTSKEG